MGGNALKNTETRRYSEDEYFAIQPKIFNKLMSIEQVSSCYLIPAYCSKTSFGDMDILYTTYSGLPLNTHDIEPVFSPNETVRNGEVMSFDYCKLQVDIIHSPGESVDYALGYFSYNDLGNLIGRITKQLGLKHGHRGLYLPLRDGNQVFDEILINRDYSKTLEFIGLDHEIFNSGFDNLEDIFRYVSSSPYYSPDYYLLEKLNHVARVRDRKRSTYRDFLEFGKNWTGPVFVPETDQTVYLPKIFDYSPESYDRFKKSIEGLATLRLSRSKFNGEIVRNLTGLTGTELGEFMQVLKGKIEFSREFVIYQSEEQIDRQIMVQYKEFKLHD